MRYGTRWRLPPNGFSLSCDVIVSFMVCVVLRGYVTQIICTAQQLFSFFLPIDFFHDFGVIFF